MTQADRTPELCVIVPLFNEEDNVIPLSEEICAVLVQQPRTFEVWLVDDASRDRTWDRIRQAAREHPEVRGLKHDRNAGQSAALWTGIQQSGSRLIATLDGDRQNNPADLLRMLELLGDVEFVCGRRAKRQDSWLRKTSSAIARAARRAALGADFADTGCALRLFERRTLEGVFGFNGLHRFLPIIVQGGGFKTLEIEVDHRPRVAGVSKYGVWNRLWRGIADLFAVAWYQRRRFPKQSSLERAGGQP